MYLYSHGDNKRKDKPKTFLVIILTAFITVVIVQNIIIMMENERENNYNAQRLSGSYNSYYKNIDYNEKIENASNIISNIQDSIVGISIVKIDGKNLFEIDAAEKWGMGTGIVISKNGYILTNQHLAQTVGASLNVTLNDGTTTKGRIVWNEKNIDLAILKIDKKNLKIAPIGNSDNIYVGDEVLAVGNPLGIEFQGTVTKGIISGLNRTFSFKEGDEEFFMEDLIQTDASINPGNSGGPLINSEGRVVGINTVKLSEAEGIGFAVPINVVKPIIERLENDDEFREASLGIYAYDREAIPYMDASVEIDRGIYVTSIDEYGPCGKTGIKEGDIIVSIDGIEIDKMIELREYIYSKKPGDEVTLKLIDGEEKDVKVILGRR